MSHYNTFSNKNKKHIIKRINFSKLYTSPYKRRRKSMLTKKWINKKSHHGCPAISNTKNRPLGPYHLWINGTSHLYDWNFWYPQEYGQKCIFLSFGERLYIMIWDAFLSLMVTRLLDTLGWLQEVQFLKLILKEKKKFFWSDCNFLTELPLMLQFEPIRAMLGFIYPNTCWKSSKCGAYILWQIYPIGLTANRWGNCRHPHPSGRFNHQ